MHGFLWFLPQWATAGPSGPETDGRAGQPPDAVCSKPAAGGEPVTPVPAGPLWGKSRSTVLPGAVCVLRGRYGGRDEGCACLPPVRRCAWQGEAASRQGNAERPAGRAAAGRYCIWQTGCRRACCRRAAACFAGLPDGGVTASGRRLFRRAAASSPAPCPQRRCREKCT